MIATPKLNETPYPVLIGAGLGYLYGHLAGVNERMCAAVAAITLLADSILFAALNYLVRDKLNISAEALYTATNTVVVATGLIAAHNLQLLSIRWTGAWLFMLGLSFAARLTMLYRPMQQV